ncbi:MULTISPECIES: carboxymuconolactone decarboxylase family protein [unclassified Roseateles]|uniref:carboxymuconolactone decarboxylase family protein n=1 Tax=unclassified Roseateles TaxID=2626991 RepID=UPI000701ED0A|nr:MULTISPECIES: carboxymuconolactone decarboxylase family protein [unclassified Roseateles]KQW46658.1 4-carboxymuconolactone decarboxylase [Pelomonas sp. Root405]KRA73710.1 4-carboxymuconolactone decarboxylase [Pelomonas sp. Root662]
MPTTVFAFAIVLALSPALAAAQTLANPAAQAPLNPRVERGMQVLSQLNRGQPQPVLEAMRADFPFLADATAGYALGDVWGRPGLDARTRQLAASAAFAALGLRGFFKTHAGYALNAGATVDELKEIVYLTTVPAGFPRAIEASQALQELLRERASQPAARE